jgi:hypothetical protein
MMGTSQYSMATDPMSGNIAQRNMAEGGVTGSGQMQLNVPINVGGGGGGDGGFSGKEYSPAGSGFGGTGGPGASFPGGFGSDVNNFNGSGGGSNMFEMPQYQPQVGASLMRGLGGKGMAGSQYSDQSQIGFTPPQDYVLDGSRQYGAPPGFQEGKPLQRGIGFARGGHLSASAGIPDTGIYYDSDLVTRGEQALGASQAKNKQLFKRAGLKYAEGPKSGIEKLGGGFSETGAGGGLSHLGGYSDGGRMLKGPGDGMSDDIPAMIGKKQPARLADGEFVVPARIVSELGNGSTEAGARKLYAMMDRVQSARSKSIGKGKVAKNSRADKYLPA